MRRTLIALALLGSVPLAACGDRDTAPEPEMDATVETAAEQPPAELQQAANAYVQAWNGSDPAAVAAFFTEDATATVGDSTFAGRDQIRERWIAPNVDVVGGLQTPAGTVTPSGEDWVAVGDYSYTAAMPGGATEQHSGRATNTWTRAADGSWKIRSARIEPAQPADSAAAPPAP